jgi:hypothetical protein
MIIFMAIPLPGPFDFFPFAPFLSSPFPFPPTLFFAFAFLLAPFFGSSKDNFFNL